MHNYIQVAANKKLGILGIAPLFSRKLNRVMNQDVYQTRRENLKALIALEGNAVRLADKLNIKPPYISQIISQNSKRTMGATLARRIERTFNLPQGWMDNEHHPENEDALQLAREILALPIERRVALRALIDTMAEPAKPASNHS